MAYYSPRYYTPSMEYITYQDTPQKHYYGTNYPGYGYGGYSTNKAGYYGGITSYTPNNYYGGFSNTHVHYPSNSHYVPKQTGYSEFIPVEETYTEFVPEHKIEYKPVTRHKVKYQEIRHETDYLRQGSQRVQPIQNSYIAGTRYTTPGTRYETQQRNNFTHTQSVIGNNQVQGYYNNLTKYI